MRSVQNKPSRSRSRHGNTSSSYRTYESNGPGVKVRGAASHVSEKYTQLARDAHAAGDTIAAENYLQHAEHYWRVMAAKNRPAEAIEEIEENDPPRPNESSEMDRFSPRVSPYSEHAAPRNAPASGPNDLADGRRKLRHPPRGEGREDQIYARKDNETSGFTDEGQGQERPRYNSKERRPRPPRADDDAPLAERRPRPPRADDDAPLAERRSRPPRADDDAPLAERRPRPPRSDADAPLAERRSRPPRSDDDAPLAERRPRASRSDDEVSSTVRELED